MSWTKKYWDALDQIYWWPRYIGLKSIPRKHWSFEGDMIAVPKAMVNPKGPLYRRWLAGNDYWEYIHRQEEPFNQIFALTFAILPGDVIGDIFSPFTSVEHDQCYESMGPELRPRYGWGANDNITMPDGFFIAEDSILAVELKFNAKTSIDQLAKYLVLFAAEEKVAGPRRNLDLLYVFATDPVEAFVRQTGLDLREVNGTLLERLYDSVRNPVIRSFIQTNTAQVRSCLSRVSVSCISWQDFFDRITSYLGQTGDNRGDRTLKRLLTGLAAEVAEHPLANVATADVKA